MNGLQPQFWEHWEQLCCYFMQEIAYKHGYSVRYRSYGSRGQSQHGVDLVPISSPLPLVGQCKMVESSFTWTDVLTEVAKTDGYEGAIECYVVFTTANRHTTIQNQQNSGVVYRHTRPDGTTFPVHVKHWADYEANDLSSIPTNVLRNIFPNAFDLATMVQPPSTKEYITSLKALQSYVPSRITLADITWLETYDFSVGWMPERTFDPFQDLYIDLQRVEVALQFRLTDMLHSAGYPEIQATLLAGKEFYSALTEFVKSVKDHIVGNWAADRMSILTVVDLNGWQRIARQFERNAQHLAQVYRKAVLGQQDH